MIHHDHDPRVTSHPYHKPQDDDFFRSLPLFSSDYDGDMGISIGLGGTPTDVTRSTSFSTFLASPTDP